MAMTKFSAPITPSAPSRPSMGWIFAVRHPRQPGSRIYRVQPPPTFPDAAIITFHSSKSGIANPKSAMKPPSKMIAPTTSNAPGPLMEIITVVPAGRSAPEELLHFWSQELGSPWVATFWQTIVPKDIRKSFIRKLNLHKVHISISVAKAPKINQFVVGDSPPTLNVPPIGSPSSTPTDPSRVPPIPGNVPTDFRVSDQPLETWIFVAPQMKNQLKIAPPVQHMEIHVSPITSIPHFSKKRQDSRYENI